jgi:hypothetical protein
MAAGSGARIGARVAGAILGAEASDGIKFNADLLSQRPEFFYACSVIRDRRVQS